MTTLKEGIFNYLTEYMNEEILEVQSELICNVVDRFRISEKNAYMYFESWVKENKDKFRYISNYDKKRNDGLIELI